MTQSQTWSANEDAILFRAVVAKILAARPELYTTPGLGPWTGHGGNKINSKLQQLLKKFGSTIPGAADVVNEEVNNITQSKKSATPTKAAKTSTPSPKKRKRAAVVKDEDEDEDDF